MEQFVLGIFQEQLSKVCFSETMSNSFAVASKLMDEKALTFLTSIIVYSWFSKGTSECQLTEWKG